MKVIYAINVDLKDGTHNVMFTIVLGVVDLALFDRLCEHE